jgi:hemerythrin
MSSEIPKELRLDHPDLDRQHGELLQLLEAAAAACDLGNRAELLAALARFTDALLAHTAEEDRLMEDSLFPDRGRHRQAHELFLADLERLRLELEASGPTPVVDEWLRVRVPEWLRFHVAVNDTKVARHLATQRGTAARAPRRPARRPS